MNDPDRLETHAWFRADPDAWVREVVAVHFHSEEGAPYWIRRAEELGLDAVKEIRAVRDLALLGFMDAEALAKLPVEDFLPRPLLKAKQELVPVESSGTTGLPKTACFTRSDFLGAFIASFRPVAESLGFPLGSPWLFIGPTGPHAIGRAVRELARVMESPEPFTVDFDPRWVRRLPEGSVARERYMDHLMDQAAAVLGREPVEILFATPPALLALAARIGEGERRRIRGIHFGGMEVTQETLGVLRAAFPGAAFLSGYGNSLFGVALEMGGGDMREMDYYPAGPRHLIRVLAGEGSLEGDAGYGETGPILMSRLDRSGFYPNVLERDHGTRISPSVAARGLGFLLDGVRNPHPPKKPSARIRTGFY